METYTLFQLNEYIRRILALNFAEPIWITAEIAQIGESRGHYFLSLVQKQEDGEEILAQSEAALWEKAHKRLRRQLGITLNEILQAGRSVKLKVQVDYHERYGLKLIIHEVDPLRAWPLSRKAFASTPLWAASTKASVIESTS